MKTLVTFLCLIRTLVWHIWNLIGIVPLACLLVLLSPFAGWQLLYRIARAWGLWAVYGMRWICGIHWRIEGLANLPTHGEKTVLLSKHQSTWETLAYLALMPRPLCFVYKKELHWIPFFGWSIGSMKMIHIDRSKRTQAFQKIVTQGQAVMAQNRWVIMFPEGTRTARGKVGDYKVGGSRLACETGAQVLPLAVNSATCWPRKVFIMRPGTIDIVICPALSSQQVEPSQLLLQVKNVIEEQMQRIDRVAYLGAAS